MCMLCVRGCARARVRDCDCVCVCVCDVCAFVCAFLCVNERATGHVFWAGERCVCVCVCARASAPGV